MSALYRYYQAALGGFAKIVCGGRNTLSYSQQFTGILSSNIVDCSLYILHSLSHFNSMEHLHGMVTAQIKCMYCLLHYTLLQWLAHSSILFCPSLVVSLSIF